MNEKIKNILLKSLMDRTDGWGAEEGMDVAKKLIKEIEDSGDHILFNISLAGIKKNDASFARESVIAVAKRYRGVKGFFLTDLISTDLLVNWESGALLLEQPINVILDGKIKLLGSKVTSSNQTVLDYINKKSEVTASEITNKLDLKLTNASTKLSKLHEQGYILRKEVAAISGGKEFIYISIS